MHKMRAKHVGLRPPHLPALWISAIFRREKASLYRSMCHYFLPMTSSALGGVRETGVVYHLYPDTVLTLGAHRGWALLGIMFTNRPSQRATPTPIQCEINIVVSSFEPV